MDVTDGSRGIPLMPPGDFINVIRQRLDWNGENGDGLELIPHFWWVRRAYTGLEHARRMNEIPGVLIPDEIFDRLARAGSAAAQGEVGVEIAAEQVRWVVGNDWSGLYLMSPARHHPVLEVLGSGLS